MNGDKFRKYCSNQFVEHRDEGHHGGAVLRKHLNCDFGSDAYCLCPHLYHAVEIGRCYAEATCCRSGEEIAGPCERIVSGICGAIDGQEIYRG